MGGQVETFPGQSQARSECQCFSFKVMGQDIFGEVFAFRYSFLPPVTRRTLEE